MSLREHFVKQLEEQMHVYALELDVYGDCGKLQCSQINMKGCELMLQKNYYFYLAFENTFSEDYVTEKILHALRHDTVPIVFGGANYTRFDNKPYDLILKIFFLFYVFKFFVS